MNLTENKTKIDHALLVPEERENRKKILSAKPSKVHEATPVITFSYQGRLVFKGDIGDCTRVVCFIGCYARVLCLKSRLSSATDSADAGCR